MPEDIYDVFLCYNSQDQDAVEPLAHRLRDAGFRVFFDRWELIPGGLVQEQLEEALGKSRTYAVFLGTAGLGRWQNQEMRVAITPPVDEESKRVIPVLLSGAVEKDLPAFLRLRGHVDFRAGLDDTHALHRLNAAIRGLVPGPGASAATPEAAKPKRQTRPRFADADLDEHSRKVTQLYRRRRDRILSGKGTQAIDDAIRERKRRRLHGPTLSPGDRLFGGRFELIERLGKGGFGTVWKTYDEERHDLVALKVLSADYLDERTKVERFLRGARWMARLQHQNIVRVIEPDLFDEEDGWRFFSMELIQGPDLERAVLDGLLTREDGLRVIHQAGEALQFAHAKGVVHRDVKPSNILLNEAMQAKLTDFDLVRATGTETPYTKTAQMMGTFNFAAPELLHSAKDAGPTADVYSLATTAVFVLLREKLPAGYYKYPHAIISEMNIPPALSRVLIKATSEDTSKRYGNAGEFVEEFLHASHVSTKPASYETRPALTGDNGRIHKKKILAVGLFMIILVLTYLSVDALRPQVNTKKDPTIGLPPTKPSETAPGPTPDEGREAVGQDPPPTRPAETLAPRLDAKKKAVIVAHNAKLYESPRGNSGPEAPFMQIFFLLEGELDSRFPVTIEPYKDNPDGYLAQGSFAVWNGSSLINFTSQSGRDLTRIFNDPDCSREYGLTGKISDCEVLGLEPRRSGKLRDDYAFLVPVFEQRDDNYLGGFVRVTTDDPNIHHYSYRDSLQLGYDLIVVVDATMGMEQWFQPTARVLRNLVRETELQSAAGSPRPPFYMGLLFYRDRKLNVDCDIGFLTRWEVEMTDQVEEVASALERSSEANCDSEEPAEAVFDALNRAIFDPNWHDGHFKTILLIGDAPPHPPTNRDKNPFAFSVENITNMSKERNLRFLTIKIGLADIEEFKSLASAVEELEGKFRAIDPDSARYEQTLMAILQEEWNLIKKSNRLYSAGIASGFDFPKGVDIDAYEVPIILAASLRPPSNSPTEFVKGWIPRKVHEHVMLDEFTFASKEEIQKYINIVEVIAICAATGSSRGRDAFLNRLRSNLSQILHIQPNEILQSNESLESVLRRSTNFSFKTTVLRFSAEEINQWNPSDFERLSSALAEKVQLLRAFIEKPGNLHLFGSVPYVYAPVVLFL